MSESYQSEKLPPEAQLSRQSTEKMKKPWSERRKLLLAIALLPVYLLLIEGILRLLYTPREFSPIVGAFVCPEWRDDHIFNLDPELFWVFRPNQAVKGFSHKYGEYRISINNIGFRGHSFPYQESKDCYRIMVLGDSCVFGWDAPDGKNFPDQLRQLLEESFSNQDFDVFMGGVPGYSSFQARRVLEKYGKRYEPHLVLVYLGTNDALPCVHEPDNEFAVRVQKVYRRNRWLGKSYLYCIFRDLNQEAIPDLKSIRRKVNWKGGPFRVPTESYAENLLQMIDYTHESLHAEAILITRQDLRPEYRVHIYNKVMRRVASEQEIVLVDIEKVFAEHENPLSLYAQPDKDKIHPNVRGYGLVAREVFERIVAGNLIPQSSSEQDLTIHATQVNGNDI